MSHVIPRPSSAQPGTAWGPASDRLAVPGTADAPAEVRLWAVRRLVACRRPYAACPDLAESLKLVASELVTNAVAHSASGQDGGFLIAAVHFPHDRVALWVFDLGPRGDRPTAPQEPPDLLDEHALLDAQHGRGLALVALHSRRYGWTAPPEHPAHSVWAEIPTRPEPIAA